MVKVIAQKPKILHKGQVQGQCTKSSKKPKIKVVSSYRIIGSVVVTLLVQLYIVH